MSAPPAVSIVIPTYNRRDRLERVLSSLLDQELDVPFEIVVVSDGSTDGTEVYLSQIAARPGQHHPVRHVRQENSGPGAARNLGVELAQGDLVVFIDDDVVPGSGMLQAHVDAHRRLGDDVVVIGPMYDPPDFELLPWVRWEQVMLYKQYAAMDAGEYDATARQFYTGNASLRREHLIAAGGFDAMLRRAEDVELAYRLADRGLRFFYENSAAGYHYAERSFDAWRSAAYVYGRHDVIFARDRGQSWIIPFMAEKYRNHHPAVRILAATSVRWPWLRRPLTRLLRAIVVASGWAGFDRVGRYGLSGIYGIEYHSGVAAELGERRRFFEVVGARTD